MLSFCDCALCAEAPQVFEGRKFPGAHGEYQGIAFEVRRGGFLVAQVLLGKIIDDFLDALQK